MKKRYWGNLRHLNTLWRALLKPRPVNLYKYHPANDYLFDIIENGRLWAGSADHLNDPYDCDFEISQDFIKSKYLDQILQPHIDAEPVTPALFEQAKTIMLAAFDKQLRAQFQKMYKSSLGVCCFTTDPLSELMWSHYAASATGVCLEFRFKGEPETHKRIVPVNYTNKRIFVHNDIDRFKMLFQKRKAWAYEKEWRLLAEAGHISFQKESLAGIIFGPRTDKALRDKITATLRQYDYHTALYQCEYGTAGLNRLPLP